MPRTWGWGRSISLYHKHQQTLLEAWKERFHQKERLTPVPAGRPPRGRSGAALRGCPCLPGLRCKTESKANPQLPQRFWTLPGRPTRVSASGDHGRKRQDRNSGEMGRGGACSRRCGGPRGPCSCAAGSEHGSQPVTLPIRRAKPVAASGRGAVLAVLPALHTQPMGRTCHRAQSAVPAGQGSPSCWAQPPAPSDQEAWPETLGSPGAHPTAPRRQSV